MYAKESGLFTSNALNYFDEFILYYMNFYPVIDDLIRLIW